MAAENQDDFQRPATAPQDRVPIDETETQAQLDSGWTHPASPLELEDSRLARPVRELIRKVRALESVGTKTSELRSEVENGLASESETQTAFEFSGTIPARLGRFQIEKLLGRGGFGLVFSALDPELDRRVALKVPRLESFASPDGQRRFLREARAAAVLGHPNIVPIFEVGKSGPALFLTLELVEGPTLAQWIQEQPRSLDVINVARLMVALGNGVQHAHSRGVVHRDLKPANVLLRQSADETRIPVEELATRSKISDFGMAQVAVADGLQTQSGALVGTPAYMAPEQVRSSREQIGPPTDVYGLGAILYELLTGKPPFSGESFGEIIRSVEEQAPVAPSRIEKSVPRDLEAICLKCLEKSPNRRYRSANELTEDLERFLNGQPIRARHAGLGEQLWRWSQRNRAIAASLLFAFAALGIGFALAISQANRARVNFQESERQKSLLEKSLVELGTQRQQTETNFDLAVAQRQRAERHLRRAEKAIDQMLNDVAATLAAVPKLASFRTTLLMKALDFERELAAEESDDPEVQIRAAEAQGKVGEIQIKLGLVTDAGQAFEGTLQRLDDINPNTDEQRTSLEDLKIKTLVFMARVNSLQGKHRESELLLQPVCEAFEATDRSQLNSDRLRSYSNALNLLARSQYRQNRFDEAELTYFSAIELLSSTPLESQTVADRTDLAMAHSSLANVYRAGGDLAKSVESYGQAISQMKLLAEEFPDQLPVRSNLILVQGNLSSAHLELREYEKAFEIAESALPGANQLIADFPELVLHHELKLMLLASRSAAFSNVGRDPAHTQSLFNETIEFGEKMLDGFEASSSVLETLSRAHSNLAYLLRDKLRDFPQAEVHFQRQIELARTLIEKYPNQTSHRFVLSGALGNLAEEQLRKGEFSLSETSFRAAIEEGKISLSGSPNTPKYRDQVARLQAHLCLALFRLSRIDDALACSDQIAAIDRESPDAWLEAARAVAHGLESTRDSGGASLSQETTEQCISHLFQHLTQAIQLGERRRPMIEDIGQRAAVSDHARFVELLSQLDER